MAPQKHARKTLWKTALYYRDNPKARKVKAKTDTKINKRPSQKKKQTELKANLDWLEILGNQSSHRYQIDFANLDDDAK